MVRWTRIAVIAGVVSVLASGCGTMDGNPVAPEAPALEMGGLGTGGNVTDPGGETESTSTTTTTAPDPVTGDTTTRGGGFGVGGN